MSYQKYLARKQWAEKLERDRQIEAERLAALANLPPMPRASLTRSLRATSIRSCNSARKSTLSWLNTPHAGRSRWAGKGTRCPDAPRD